LTDRGQDNLHETLSVRWKAQVFRYRTNGTLWCSMLSVSCRSDQDSSNFEKNRPWLLGGTRWL